MARRWSWTGDWPSRWGAPARPRCRRPTNRRWKRWLADEPVKAYREQLTVRVRRWGRRHRPLVAGAATLLVMAVVLLVVLNVHSERARLVVERAQAQTAAERDAKEEERQKAEMAR